MISIIHRLAIIVVVVVGYTIIFYIFQLGFFFQVEVEKERTLEMVEINLFCCKLKKLNLLRN